MDPWITLGLIRSASIAQATLNVASEEHLQNNVQTHLERFYDLLYTSLKSDDPECLNPILNEWIVSRTQTDLETRQSVVVPLLNVLLKTTIQVARERLNERQAIDLLEAVLPIYTYAVSYTTQNEINLCLDYITSALEEKRLIVERSDASKSDFISIAAHELKTPLTLIDGYAAMLADYLTHLNIDSQPKLLLQGIEKGTNRLRQIINAMVDVSLIDNSLLSLSLQPIRINRLLNSLFSTYEEKILERNQEFIIEDFPVRDEIIYADPERLQQALENIIVNAIKYTPDGGKIIITGRKIPGFIEIDIEDTGIGIAPEDQTLIFEKFRRLDKVSLHSSGNTKYKGGGPGLGLPITKGIIEAHGGVIWVESHGYDEVKYPGTIFHILLPDRKTLSTVEDGSNAFGRYPDV